MNLSKTLIDNDVSTCQKERRIYILVLQTASKAFTKACKQAALQKPILTSKLVKILIIALILVKTFYNLIVNVQICM